MLCCAIVAYRVKGQSKRSPVRIAKDIWLTAMRPAHEFIVEPEVMALPLVRKTIVGVRITTIVLVIVLFTVSLVAHDCLHCSNVALSVPLLVNHEVLL